MASKIEKSSRTENSPIRSRNGASKPKTARNKANAKAAAKAIANAVAKRAGPGRQNKVGLALIAASLFAVMAAGGLLGPDPLTGAAQWVRKGLIQASYAVLLALFAWIVLHRRREISYVLLLGVICAGIAAWDTGAGIYASRLRLEANKTLITLRDAPLNVEGLAETIERNPYVEAYIVMRDVYWEFGNRLDDRIASYGASYKSYVGSGDFLDTGRLRSRLELWRTFYQIGDLERQLAQIESEPLKADDLLWTVNLLDVDTETREAYARDLQDTISAATTSQAELIARERRTLARIKQSLQVLINAEGRYRIADGRVVFEDPADAALFAGEEAPAD